MNPKIKLVVALTLLGLPGLSKARTPLTIQIDKGTVSLEVAPGINQPQIQSKRNAYCDDEATVDYTSDQIRIKHPEKCQRGNDFHIKIGIHQSVDVALKAGALSLKNSARAFREFSEVKSVALYGDIASTVPGLVPARTENYAGATAIYKSANPSKKESLNLMVQTGSINL